MKQNNRLKSFLSSGCYPLIFQLPTLLVFILILFELLTGIQDANRNFGSVMTWFLWWPALGITFLLIGRIWCTVCPFALINDTVQKLVGNRLPAPRFLKRNGLWVIICLFILLTWGEDFFGIIHVPTYTAIMLFMIITGVVFSGAFFERRTWCRYVCPLGGMAGIYSRMGFVQIRADRAVCMKCRSVECYKGNQENSGCPLFEFPRILSGNANCNFCGICLKNCPNDSPRISFRRPSSELWSIERPSVEESFLATLMIGLIAGLNLLEVSEAWLPGFLGIDDTKAAFTLFYVISLFIPFCLMGLASAAASTHNRLSLRENFCRFGYAFIPIVLAAHIGHTGKELLEKGLLIFQHMFSFWGVATIGCSPCSLVNEETIVAIHVLLYIVGLLLSLYAAWRIAKACCKSDKVIGTLVPFAGVMLLFTGANLFFILMAE